MKRKKFKNSYRGIRAYETEPYEGFIENEISIQETDRASWAHPIVIMGITIGLSVTDALVLYSILDIAMLQSAYMGKIMAFTIALVLNFLPLVAAKYTKQAVYKVKRYAGLWAIVSILAFVILFLATVYLRFAYMDTYGVDSTTQLTNQVTIMDGEEREEEIEENPKSMAIVILLAVEPLVTSILNFALGYLTDDEIKARLNRLRIRRLELYEMESDLQAALSGMDFEYKELLEIDQEKYNEAQNEVNAKCELLKALARHYLAEYLANPSAISKLSQETITRRLSAE